MCRATRCRQCGNVTWAGCGRHVAQVKSAVPADQWCPGHATGDGADGNSWVRRLLGR